MDSLSLISWSDRQIRKEEDEKLAGEGGGGGVSHARPDISLVET